jgi:hypothetical protein
MNNLPDSDAFKISVMWSMILEKQIDETRYEYSPFLPDAPHRQFVDDHGANPNQYKT